ncbi:MAG: hypothetical protein U1D55_13085 [Phycisphaerae bacterium]
MSSFLRKFAFAAAALSAAASSAETITVGVRGTVEYNQITSGSLAAVTAGQSVTLSFTVDSSNFVNSPNFPTRGYIINAASFSMTFPTLAVGLANPLPVGQTPAFVIRNNDPAVDGFLLSTNIEFPVGVPLNVNGGFGLFRDNFYVTYGGARLPSLDIHDALGHYDYTGLTVFNFTVDDGPFNPLGVIFTDMDITGCVGDLDHNGSIGESDLGILLSAWNTSAAGDLDGDGQTSESDLGIFLARWGTVCP